MHDMKITLLGGVIVASSNWLLYFNEQQYLLLSWVLDGFSFHHMHHQLRKKVFLKGQTLEVKERYNVRTL